MCNACGKIPNRRKRASSSAQRLAATSAISAASAASAASVATTFTVAGTWDFKWPLDTEIRVAFQQPPTEPSIPDFDRAKTIVQGYFADWFAAVPKMKLTYRFVNPDLDPPFGAENSLTDQHRSTFKPQDPLDRPYDVLISLQNLPVVRVDPFQSSGALHRDVQFPDADLGTFALHADYGAPTAYLGRFQGWRDLHKDGSLVNYLESPLGKHITLHEIGHILGLPHIHQHPNLLGDTILTPEQLLEQRRDHFRTESDIQRRFITPLGEPPGIQLIFQNIIEPWPGSSEFSDWVEFTPDERRDYRERAFLDSIMSHPYYEQLVASGPDNVPLRQGGPGQLDKRMLERMYVTQ